MPLSSGPLSLKFPRLPVGATDWCTPRGAARTKISFIAGGVSDGWGRILSVDAVQCSAFVGTDEERGISRLLAEEIGIYLSAPALLRDHFAFVGHSVVAKEFAVSCQKRLVCVRSV